MRLNPKFVQQIEDLPVSEVASRDQRIRNAGNWKQNNRRFFQIRPSATNSFRSPDSSENAGFQFSFSTARELLPVRLKRSVLRSLAGSVDTSIGRPRIPSVVLM